MIKLLQRGRVLLILMIQLISSAIGVKGQINQKQLSLLDSILYQYYEIQELSGFSIGIVKGEKFTYTKSFGKKNINVDEVITPNSVFHIASLSKNITATAIMKLVENGKLKLDDKLCDILPYFKLKDQRYKQITIKHILLHTSGIRDIKKFEWDTPQYKNNSAQNYLKAIVDTLQLDFTPGEKDKYSNLAFDFLADVIATIAGKSFEEYVQNNILSPLDMKNSTFLYPKVSKHLRTSPHILGNDFYLHVGDTYPYNRIHAPSSTMQSSIEDMMKWAKFNLQKGKFDNNQILREENFNELTKVQMELNPNISFGLSWAISPYDNKRMIYNSGGDLGFRSFIAFIPEDSLAIVTLSNCEYFPAREIAFTAINIVKGKRAGIPSKPLYLALGKTLSKKGISGVKEEYKQLKEDKNSNYRLDDVGLNDFARQLINQNRLGEAVEIMKLNVESHPESSFCYDNLAGVYRMQKNYSEALINYKKALSLKPNNQRIINTIAELESLIDKK
jgi:CubicO group peptidase (beta-lactamase class C family)